MYIRKDVQLKKNFMNLNYIHYYNEIPYTRWPFFLAISLFTTVFYLLLSLKRFDWSLQLGVIGLGLVAYYMFMWFNDMFIESSIFGKYNRKIRACLVYGFVLFILSECALFSGFFWTYFDRFFHPSIYTGNNALPYGIQPIYKSTTSFIATLLLMSSGVIFNYSAYLLRTGVWNVPSLYIGIGILFGFSFLYIQYTEYNNILTFNITESVYGSIFYFLTGFHGLHVVVGLIFLSVTFLILESRSYYTRERHFSLSLAIFYWHFVDLIWIFLYFSVYVWNLSNSYYYLWDVQF
jgi:heme/copper-type cytochrome/quinol oxidase subunit 3